jgi:hypothetical protein
MSNAKFTGRGSDPVKTIVYTIFMLIPLTPELEEYIKILASSDQPDILKSINLNAVIDEFIETTKPGIAYLDEERKRLHFITIRNAEFGKSYYGKKNEYFCEFGVELNFPIWIGVIIRMFEKVIMFINVFFRKSSKFKFFI